MAKWPLGRVARGDDHQIAHETGVGAVIRAAAELPELPPGGRVAFE
jgi:hypothetical protein